MGYRVGVIKSSSETGIPFDREGTDTWKHKEAGAESVMFVGPDQMVLQTRNSGISLRTLAHRYFADVDIVIGEGFKAAVNIPKIEVVRDSGRLLRDEVHGVIAVATDREGLGGDHIFRLNESLEIARFIEKRYLSGKRRGIERTVLYINGRKIPIKEYIQEVLAATVQGFVSSLKSVDEIEEIELRIRSPKNEG